jgi:transcriptional regulator with XRE-family HTH domain
MAARRRDPPPDLGAVIAANVRGERARQHLRQTDLADLLGWQRSSVGHLESGRRAVRAADLPALCRVLGVDLPKLLDGADPEDRRALGV